MSRTEGTYELHYVYKDHQAFLSPDNYVQAPDNSQNFNRYAYCLNNPLKYTDPSGWRMLGAMNYSNPFHENWGVNFAEHVVTSHEAREILWNMGISVGTWMMGNEVCGMSGGGLGSDYTVDRKGYVENMGDNDMTYDILYTSAAYADGDYSNRLIVYDLSILAGLTEDRADYQMWIGNGQAKSGNYTSTESIDEAFKVYYFMTQNTDVEWTINGFRTDGANEYVIATMHNESSVTRVTNVSKYSVYNQIFSIHNHPHIDGTKGGSWVDVHHVKKMHINEFNSKDINRWFVHNGRSTTFPKHYVYHNHSSVLYYYLPDGRSDIYIRKINIYKDLYRNLGF